MATKAEVRLRALRELGIVQVNQAAPPHHDSEMKDSYDEVYAAIKEQGLATWTSTAAIPDEVTPHVVALVAINRADTYGISNERFQRLAGKAAGAMVGIRSLVNPPFESLDSPKDY